MHLYCQVIVSRKGFCFDEKLLIVRDVSAQGKEQVALLYAAAAENRRRFPWIVYSQTKAQHQAIACMLAGLVDLGSDYYHARTIRD